MAKRVKRRATKQKALNIWWVRFSLSVLLIIAAYVFASLAIDSGSLLQYGICLVLVYWAFANAVRGVRLALAR